MTILKAIGKKWLPPVLADWLRDLRGDGVRLQGEYATWEAAAKHGTGYDSAEIFRRVREASLRVKRGEAAFERDGVCYYHEEYNWELLACLMKCAAENCGALRVLDFGGALGSVYFQHRKLFGGLNNPRWGIVEQGHYVECGRKEFQDESLRFYNSAKECFEEIQVNLILLSSVLQYFEKPHALITQLANKKAKNIIVTRTPFVDHEADSLVIQQVSKNIFPAKLPMWIFSERHFESEMNQLGYFRRVAFPCAEENVGAIKFSGILYSRDEP